MKINLEEFMETVLGKLHQEQSQVQVEDKVKS